MLTSKTKLMVFLIVFILSFCNLSAQLKAHSNQADYIIITPSKFIQTLQPFVDWRMQKNLDIEVVKLSQIYSEFSDSTKSSSIRNFISYTLSYWNDPKPKYALLVGGTELLPSYRVPSQFANYPDHKEDSVSIDEWYSINLYEPDKDPDISLGRFPVNNEEELNNIINKTIYFEDSLTSEDYSTDFLFLTDKADSLIFEWTADGFINSHLPSNFSYESIYAGQDSTIEVSRERLFNGLNNGSLFFSYYGHGAPYQWSEYGLFTFEDIKSLQRNYLPFIYTAAACSQSFDFPDDSSIVKNLIVSNGNGTVASIAATGLNYLAQGDRFLTNFYNNIFEKQDISIGEALIKAKISSSWYNSIDGIWRRYTLVGDPALRIPIDIIAQITDRSSSIPDSYTLEQNYPNPFNPTTKIEFSIPSDDNVQLKVFNVLGMEVATLLNSHIQAGTHIIEFNASNLSSGVYFYKVVSGNYSEIKKMILLR